MARKLSKGAQPQPSDSQVEQEELALLSEAVKTARGMIDTLNKQIDSIYGNIESIETLMPK